MTDLRALLAPIRARAEGRTKGDWTAYDRGIGYEIHSDGWPINDGHKECFSKGDAEFIANAPMDLSRLLAAIEAVEALADEWDAIAKGTTQFDSALRVCAHKARHALAAALGSDTTNQEGTQ